MAAFIPSRRQVLKLEVSAGWCTHLGLRHHSDSLISTTTAFAFSRNLSVITQNATTVLAFGFIQDPAVLFVDTNGQPQRRVPYFKTKYSTPEDLVSSCSQLY